MTSCNYLPYLAQFQTGLDKKKVKMLLNIIIIIIIIINIIIKHYIYNTEIDKVFFISNIYFLYIYFFLSHKLL